MKTVIDGVKPLNERRLLNGLGLLLSLAAAAILCLGFRKIAEMELDEYQVYTATLDTLLLAATFVILAVIVSFHEPPR